MVKLKYINKDKLERKVLSTELEAGVTDIIPSKEIFSQAPGVGMGRKAKDPSTACEVKISCKDDDRVRADYTCRMDMKSRSKDLRYWWPNRIQGVETCTDEFLGLKQNDAGDDC